MAEGDYHVEARSGTWIIEQEGSRKSQRQHVETLANADQAWRIAVYYAQAGGVDVFLHEHRSIKKAEHFREGRRR